jgi:hypothetical protein
MRAAITAAGQALVAQADVGVVEDCLVAAPLTRHRHLEAGRLEVGRFDPPRSPSTPGADVTLLHASGAGSLRDLL